jgi:carbohydrate-selective porin OprB
VAEFVFDEFTARYAFAAMPTVANGVDLSYHFEQAGGQQLELETRNAPLHLFLPKQKGGVRLLSFSNRANMGVYRDQNRVALAAGTAPVITAHTFGTSIKYGFGANFEQELPANVRAYGRFGWNEGQHESFAYTEVDQTISLGADWKPFTHRPNDKLGSTFISNAIKRDHQFYLAHGGQGFLLGDGRLNYAREDILETYYNLYAGHGIYYALDAQYITHPGYNQDRGPVLVESVRMHIDF